MTENIKKLLELASANEELKNKLTNAAKEDILAIAKENGIALTDADFEQNSEVCDDELTAVAGGKKCTCYFGGGGTGESDDKSKTCACVAYGEGNMKDGTRRCLCTLNGSGVEAVWTYSYNKPNNGK